MREKTLEFSLAGALRQEHVIALGWLLANGATREMQEALCAPAHIAEVKRIQEALGRRRRAQGLFVHDFAMSAIDGHTRFVHKHGGEARSPHDCTRPRPRGREKQPEHERADAYVRIAQGGEKTV